MRMNRKDTQLLVESWRRLINEDRYAEEEARQRDFANSQMIVPLFSSDGVSSKKFKMSFDNEMKNFISSLERNDPELRGLLIGEKVPQSSGQEEMLKKAIKCYCNSYFISNYYERNIELPAQHYDSMNPVESEMGVIEKYLSELNDSALLENVKGSIVDAIGEHAGIIGQALYDDSQSVFRSAYDYVSKFIDDVYGSLIHEVVDQWLADLQKYVDSGGKDKSAIEDC